MHLQIYTTTEQPSDGGYEADVEANEVLCRPTRNGNLFADMLRFLTRVGDNAKSRTWIKGLEAEIGGMCANAGTFQLVMLNATSSNVSGPACYSTGNDSNQCRLGSLRV